MSYHATDTKQSDTKSGSEVIIACDFHSDYEFQQFIQQFSNQKLILKIGTEFLYSLGWRMVRELKASGHRIMLDLKLHDIPNTVHETLKAIKQYAPDYVTLHLAGGPQMIAAAQSAVQGTAIKLIGVAWLTSLSAQDAKMLTANPQADMIEIMQNRINIGYQAGIKHFVISVQDLPHLAPKFPRAYWFCPGIKFNNQGGPDQQRTADVQEAVKAGVDYIIIGRAITQSPSPAQTYQKILHFFGK